MKRVIKYLEELINIPSPTGMTDEITEFLVAWGQEKGLPVHKTHKGAVIIRFEGSSKGTPLILASHLDTLGAMVTSTEKGIELTPIGGYPAMYLLGNYCTIHTGTGPLSGTILPKNPASHVNNKLKDMSLKFSDLEVRIDHLPLEGKDVVDLVETGDFISLNPDFTLAGDFIKSRHLDDKASAAVLMALAEDLVEVSLKRPVEIYFNVTEETGQGLAVSPDAADLLVVDMGVVGKGCRGRETHVSICAKDSAGPFHYGFTRELKDIASKEGISFVMDVFPYYASDGRSALAAGKDYRVALIGPGVGASHGWERTHVSAIKGVYNLLKAYIAL